MDRFLTVLKLVQSLSVGRESSKHVEGLGLIPCTLESQVAIFLTMVTLRTEAQQGRSRSSCPRKVSGLIPRHIS